ncbi:predicted protein [Nematostella vectensis]|uniref:Uncharacterized protein n=1 Tax=Nematostella vectensis TaxID=45351 RepID=A7SLN3_NEMVE|nr:predicted protein [Nematostella vectensis]|eukprot:XP_001627494.1 predicted protein [Nematostella vectensis]
MWIGLLILVVTWTGISDGATIVQTTAKLHLCKPDCTEYAITITPSIHGVHLRVYKFHRRKHIVHPSDIKQLKPRQSFYEWDIKAAMNSSCHLVEALQKLTKAATKVIPKSYHQTTPIYVFIPYTVKQTMKGMFPSSFYGPLKQFLDDPTQHPFLPTFSQSITVIKCEILALFQWSTLNFLRGAFLHEHFKDTTDVVGMIDFDFNMKVSIGFETNSTSHNITEILTIYSTPHFVVAKSYTKRGYDHFLKAYFDTIVSLVSKKQLASKKPLKSPCSPTGSLLTVTNGTSTRLYIGTGNISHCRQVLKKTIDTFKLVGQSPYAIEGAASAKLYGLPETANVLKKIGCNDCEVSFTATKIDKLARAYCSKKTKARGTEVCANANFIYVMITQVYHIPKDTKIFVAKKEYNGLEMTWELGVLIHKMNMLLDSMKP